MLRALYSSATGMNSQQLNLDVTANNLANVNTTGFKKTKIEFQDLVYQTDQVAGAEQDGGTQEPTGIQIGHGTQLASTAKVFTTGELTRTDEDLDVAIHGNGFFEVQLPDGTLAYTRDGAFKMDNTGQITTSQGYLVQSGFQPIAQNHTDINIAPDGTVTVGLPDGQESFNVQLVRFQNPSGLRSVGGNLYTETEASGVPEPGEPATNGFGTLQQRYLEMSNVKVVEEMVNLIVAQRAYEVSAKSIQAADEMLQMANNLRR